MILWFRRLPLTYDLESFIFALIEGTESYANIVTYSDFRSQIPLTKLYGRLFFPRNIPSLTKQINFKIQKN